ncbi:uncharacterized protein LOC121865648 [Homarus americanus]|uniref:uncharacterized protein LOC121865648 n=1 Tax=Homarus americanus TaxID=6706 RepID=UPI001C44DD07|nr:uncharacterized protein LOC121865648 [Homarus americanus]
MGVLVRVPTQKTAKFKNAVRLKNSICIRTEHTKGVLTFSPASFEPLSEAPTRDSNLLPHRANGSPGRKTICSVEVPPVQKTIIKIAVLSSAQETFYLQTREKNNPKVLGDEKTNSPTRFSQQPKQAINSTAFPRTQLHTVSGSSGPERLSRVSPEINSLALRTPRDKEGTTSSVSRTTRITKNCSSSHPRTADTVEINSLLPPRTSSYFIKNNQNSVSLRTSNTAKINSSTLQRIPDPTVARSSTLLQRTPARDSQILQGIPDPVAGNTSTLLSRTPAPQDTHAACQVMGPSRARWSPQKRGPVRSPRLRLVLVVLLLAACKVEEPLTPQNKAILYLCFTRTSHEALLPMVPYYRTHGATIQGHRSRTTEPLVPLYRATGAALQNPWCHTTEPLALGMIANTPKQ